MTPSEIRELIAKLDSRSVLDRDKAWVLLKPLGSDVVPYLAAAYPKFKKWQGRVALVFYCTRYSREHQGAFELGVVALQDKATLVRYRACGVLAYSLRKEAVPHLQELANHSDLETVRDARAAIDAINNQNHHFFIDRGHSGQQFWVVNDGDREETNHLQAPYNPAALQKGWWQFWK